MGKLVGTMTFHKSINYGSALQAYALQKTILSLGYKSEIIDYKPKAIEEIYRLYEKNNSFRNVMVNIIRRIPAKKSYDMRARAFKNFQENNLIISTVQYDVNSDFSTLNHYYAIVCGSDQIWNVRADDADDAYFLPAKLDAKKIAYAASVNDTDYTEERCDDKLRTWMNDFSYISIREKTGCQKVEAFLGRDDVFNAIDPTVLLAKEEYKAIESKPFLTKPYIFLFTVKFSQDTVDVARKLSMKTGLPVYTLMTSGNSYKYVHSNDIRILSDRLSPSDFLRYIDDAALVVSDSFHGTAFSVIFEKKFFSVNNRKTADSYENDERIFNFLNRLNLTDRIITIQDVDKIDINKEISYELVNPIKNKIVEESTAFLKNALEG